MSDLDVPYIDGQFNQEKEYWYNKIVSAVPELKGHPEAMYGDNRLLFLRLVNEGLIDDQYSSASPEDIAAALQQPGLARNAIDNATATNINRGGTSTRAAINSVIDSEVRPLLTGMVRSSEVTQIIRTSDPAVMSSAGADSLVLFEGPRPDGHTAFRFENDNDIASLWGNANPPTITDQHVFLPASSDNGLGVVHKRWSNKYRDVDIVARMRWGATGGGLGAGIFIHGGGPHSNKHAIYVSTQTFASADPTVGGLRLNALVDSTSGILPFATNKTARNATWRTSINTDYYYRLRGINGSYMAKQWLATDPEPDAWDLLLTPTDIPAPFKAGGGYDTGYAGIFSHSRTYGVTCDYFAIAFNGESAQVVQ